MAWDNIHRAARLLKDAEGRDRLRKAGRREFKSFRRRALQRMNWLKVDLPEASVPEGPIRRPEIKAAVILDTFTDYNLRFEWEHLRLLPDRWRQQLSSETVDLLFVESAWRGNGGAWRNSMSSAAGPSNELRELVQHCRAHGIPTVFWNKEDPPNYDRFIETAKLFDHIFTVDADRIPNYQRDLGHDQVGLLPFGAQPRIHNPIRQDRNGAARPHDVAFAGSYFAEKHDERRRQMHLLFDAAIKHDFDIYSRMQHEGKQYEFPARYAGRIVGSLPYEKMLSAYTAYKVFLNVNSVTTSPTMCARRLFELSAAQTPVLSGPAAAIEPFFGGSISVVDDPDTASETLTNLLTHKELRDRQGLCAHRRVFDEHLMTHRVDTVLNAIGLPPTKVDESISAVIPTMRPEQLANVWRFLHGQSHDDVELVLVTHGFEPRKDEIDRLQQSWPLKHHVIIPAASDLPLGTLMNLGLEAASGRYVAKMDDDNYYAKHYLKDLVRAFLWTDAQVVGKWAHYVHIGDETGPTLLRFAFAEHRYVKLVQGGTILTPRDVAAELRFEELPRRVDTTFLEKIHRDGGRVYSSDRFNFVSTRTADASGHTWGVSASHLLANASSLEFFGPAEAHVTV